MAATAAGSIGEASAFLMSAPRPGGTGRAVSRRKVAVTVAVLLCIGAALLPPPSATPATRRPPNVLLVITDDQRWDTVPTRSGPPAMPWLESRLADPADHWTRFTNAFVNVPLCCPSRVSILTGRYAHRTGVEDNGDGESFDESSTLATWLDAAGYQTGYIGKYLNAYPWDRGPYVPAGWDRFLAKRNLDSSTTYAGYPFVDQGVPLRAAAGPSGYATTLLEREALAFLRGASRDRPWFLVFAPSAPHEPWIPAPVDAGTFAGVDLSTPSRVLNDVRGKPAWIRARPRIDAADAASLATKHRRALETLRAVDRALASLVAEIASRGELDRTLIVVLTDNGYAFGEHRWAGKRCPYDACVRTPFVVRSPWGRATTVDVPVSAVDVAPTIVDLAGLRPVPVDGISLRPLIDDRSEGPRSIDRRAVLVEWAGDAEVPPWRSLRTESLTYVEHADGTVELYDRSGSLAPPDPDEIHNRAGDPRYAAVIARLAAALAEAGPPLALKVPG